jgi:hypothetical protein
VFKRSSRGIAVPLSWLIKKIKEPTWDRWGWHMAPVVGPDQIADAQMPKVKIVKLSDLLLKGVEIRAYRVMAEPPGQDCVDIFLEDHIGKRYDGLVYLWTGIRQFASWFPRIIDRWYDCWEVSFDAMDYAGVEIDPSDYNYPFVTDFLKLVGELKS